MYTRSIINKEECQFQQYCLKFTLGFKYRCSLMVPMSIQFMLLFIYWYVFSSAILSINHLCFSKDHIYILVYICTLEIPTGSCNIVHVLNFYALSHRPKIGIRSHDWRIFCSISSQSLRPMSLYRAQMKRPNNSMQRTQYVIMSDGLLPCKRKQFW